jgi:hypothetical protein
MFNLFESRNRKIADLVKLGDYLGRSLRSNVHLFSIDGIGGEVTYLSENEKLIKGIFAKKGNQYILENIEIEDSSVFTDDERFDDYMENQVSLFLGDIYNDKVDEAQSSFESVLGLWESRARYNNVAKKLDQKRTIFNETQNIIQTQEFLRFIEVLPELSNFLKENKDSITSVPEIANSMKLSAAISKAFNTPHISYDDLENKGRFVFENTQDKSIYEIICKQELIRKEILEAKESFDLVWATEPSVIALSKTIYGSDEEIGQALSEAIKNVPYLCLISKKKINETMQRTLGEHFDDIPSKDLKQFTSKLFEMKKPAKNQLIELLQEQYGVNLQYIKEIPTFKSLLNTQVVIFEALSRTAPRGSVLKSVLSEMSTLLKSKNGVEAIDINAILQQLFEYVDYNGEELPLMESFTFDQVSAKFKKVDSLVEVTVGDEDSSEVEDAEEAPDEADAEAEAEEEVPEQEDEAPVGEEQEEEMKKPKMSDAELMAALKDLESIFTDVTPETDPDE